MTKIACIPGDGIGIEVTKEAFKIFDVIKHKHGLKIDIENLDYGAERYLKDGTMLPDGEINRFKNEVDAIYLCALGDPRIKDMRHGRGILLKMRFELELFINLRPISCLAEKFCPLKYKNAKDIDFIVFRENTEGPYVGMGGNFKINTMDEVAITQDVNTRKGVERIIRAAFEYAHTKNQKVTMADKSNAMSHAHGLWLRTFEQVSKEYPHISSNHMYIDALVMEIIRKPEQFDIVVTNNIFGDIITDLGAQLQGGMGMATSANINPNGVSLFEPVHGSAPDIVGQNKANPIASILTTALMLEHLNFTKPAEDIKNSVQKAILNDRLTVDVGGTYSTSEVGDYIANQITL